MDSSLINLWYRGHEMPLGALPRSCNSYSAGVFGTQGAEETGFRIAPLLYIEESLVKSERQKMLAL